MKTTENLFIRSRQVELVYRNQTLGQVVSIAIACYLAWVAQKEGVSVLGLGIWCAAAVSIALLRLVFARHYMQLSPEARSATMPTWHLRVRFGALASGLVWAAGSLLMMNSGNLSLQLFSAFVLSGMTAGAIPVLGADKWSYRMYAWPIILSVIFGVFDIDHMHIAFSVLATLALIIFTRSADVFEQMLRETFELEHEKTQLLTSVEQARQAAEKSDLAKTQFLANVSHELRTPMNGILGLSQLLASDPLTPDQAELLSLLRENADGLMRQIDHLIELSALEAGHVKANPAPFAVADLLEGMISSQRRPAMEKGLALVKDADPELPPVLVGDLERLRQIFEHLVGNAIKFTESGTVSISAKLLEKKGDQARVEFCVTDTGPGISEEKLQVINGLFAQGDSSLIRRHGGIGVGLPISRKLIELLGGEIRFHSEIGIGSKFCFTLPFALEANALSAAN